MPQIFPKATRQPGILESGDKVVPAGAAGHKYLVLVNIDQADLDDPAVIFDLRMYVRNPDGSWVTPDPNVHNEGANGGGGVTFNGGPSKDKNGNPAPAVAPGFLVDGDEQAGNTVRFWLNNKGRAVDLGLDADPV